MEPERSEVICPVDASWDPLSERDYEKTAALFRAIGDPERLKTIHVLTNGRQCVGQLAAVLGSSMSSISQRLKILYAADLVRREKVGKHVYYELADHHVWGMLQNGIEHATAPHGEPCVTDRGK